MRYRQLAPGIEVSEIGFGNWTVTTGWWGDYSEQQAIDLHRAAFDAGITFFDTSDAYAEGYAEQVLGKALGDVRDKIVIATKFGYDLERTHERRGQQERPHRTDIAYLRDALEGSLRRLGVDTIDFYQLHNPKMPHIDEDELFTFLEQAKAEGKVRTYGVALGPAIGWLDEGVRALRERRIDGLQMIYNLLEQDPGRALIEVARETGAGLVVRVPHSSGMLEGKFTEQTVFDKNDHRRHRPRSWLIEGLQKIARLDFLLEGRTLGQAALRWILKDPEIATTLPNIYGQEQIEEFAGASDVPDLTDEEIARVAELYERNFDIVPSGDMEKLGA